MLEECPPEDDELYPDPPKYPGDKDWKWDGTDRYPPPSGDSRIKLTDWQKEAMERQAGVEAANKMDRAATQFDHTEGYSGYDSDIQELLESINPDTITQTAEQDPVIGRILRPHKPEGFDQQHKIDSYTALAAMLLFIREAGYQNFKQLTFENLYLAANTVFKAQGKIPGVQMKTLTQRCDSELSKYARSFGIQIV